ncbi:MAG: hypothetical protein NXH86_03005 [Flavobacteriaceae bacterium]|jgi:hypothetical protein|uniref:hypothetical protein n=1 Tax=Flagellimonas TaxID=444459 RepID=UPI000E25E885|nr:hypothetical protein [Allomuricauda sp.]MCR9263096.1 hypothetical protein [Flavobacteriaceae bacterium]
MESPTLPDYLQSIFHPLLEHAKDLECKLMLLDEMLEVGDKKEIPLLKELESHDHPKISHKAFEVRTALQSKLGMDAERERRRLPMSLCFIYDEFNIRPSKIDPDLEFGVSLDILDSE